MLSRLALVSCAFVACSAPPEAAATSTAGPSIAELGGHHFAISTHAPAAQARFDEGLAWCNGFHHAEALRCFGAAATADPDCAMAFWGLAYAAGPHINNMEMDAESAQQANTNAQRAAALASGSTPVERALIDAVVERYTWPAPADRKELDVAYAAAMRRAYEAHGEHADVAALFAEALMDLHPWDLYVGDGSPQPWTAEIVTVLEKVLAAHPEHPLANHLYIHAVEASSTPARATTAAERLRDLAPAVGHLVHMPAHIFMRLGRYEEAAEANRRGIAADLRIVERTGRTGFYEVYRAHNYHFLAFAAMFTGNAHEAISAGRELVRQLPMDVVQQIPQFLEGFLGMPYHTLVRFGRWQELIEAAPPEPWQKSAVAMYHYGRGIAYAALDQVDAAAREREAFRAAVQAVPEDWTMGNNPSRTVLAIGDAMLEGEVEFRRGNHDIAFAALRIAVALDEALRYDEPWGWMMPPRHALGALLLEAGKVADAEQVYRADLVRHPGNGWALRGLAECLERSGNTAEANLTRGRFEVAWRHADVRIESSCFCRR
ncbi:MAG TPA: hypothetical protein VFZ65_19875 [Planctomycetota bacterium]|nr:hypothetical protein [Planctomycetota bacterium]